MTEREIITWLGFGPQHPVMIRNLQPGIVKGMKTIPVPTDALSQLAAFRAFLKCAPIPEHAIFVPKARIV